MFERIIRGAIEQRWLVMLAVAGMAAFGIYSYQRLPIDAVPDITNVQVQINTQVAGYSPLEAGAAGYLSDRNRHGRFAEAGANALLIPLWPIAGHSRVQGWDRYLLCPADGQ